MFNNETALQLSPGQLNLVVAPRALGRQLNSEMIVQLALAPPKNSVKNGRGAVRVVDGGNCFDARGIARLLRRQTSELYAALERIQVQRAFTCYQMLAMLIHSSTNSEPLLVLDMLATFYDESVSKMERLRLLEHSLGQLRRLSSIATVVVSAPPPPVVAPGQAAPGEFLERLAAAADQVVRFETPPEPEQSRLF
jgi:hypothetical protein